jgi:hypothetical protein
MLVGAQLEPPYQRLEGNHMLRRPSPTTPAAPFDRPSILVQAYQGDGVRITVAVPASNNRVLRLLASHTPLTTS